MEEKEKKYVRIEEAKYRKIMRREKQLARVKLVVDDLSRQVKNLKPIED